jgi:hypothetical protein
MDRYTVVYIDTGKKWVKRAKMAVEIDEDRRRSLHVPPCASMYHQCATKKKKKVNKNNDVPLVPAKVSFTRR